MATGVVNGGISHRRCRTADRLGPQMSARFLVIDDRKGRRIAQRRGIAVVGLAGVLLAAKTRGLLPQVSSALAELAAQGYRLLMQIIQLAGESTKPLV